MIEEITRSEIRDFNIDRMLATKLNEVIDYLNKLEQVDIIEEPKESKGIWKSQQQVAVDQAVKEERQRIIKELNKQILSGTWSEGANFGLDYAIKIVEGKK